MAVGEALAAPDPAPARDRRAGWAGRAGRALERVAPLAAVAAVWWVLAAVDALGDDFVLPPPDAVAVRAAALWRSGALPEALGATVWRVLASFALALAVGVPLGTAMGHLPAVNRALRPLVSFAFPVPKIALYPALLIVLGFGAPSKIALGVLEALFPIVLATAAATSQVDRRLVWSARSLGTGPGAVLRRVVLPAALPGVLTGARIGLVGALIGVFVAEMVSSLDGLGHLMVNGWRLLQNADVYAAIVTVSLLGLVLDRSFVALRRRLVAWQA